MHSRMVRWLLPTVLLAGGSGLVAWTWELAQDVQRLDGRARQTFALIDRVDDRLDRFAGPALSYATSGYADRATLGSAADQLREILVDSSSVLSSAAAADAPPAGTIVETAAGLANVLRRARENLDADLEVMAADLLFTETTDGRQSLRSHFRELRASEFDRLAQARASDVTRAWAALACLALLAAWALVRWSRAPRAASGEAGALTAPAPSLPAPSAARSPGPPEIDVAAAAELCTDIARLESETDVQPVLRRTARLVGARGVVLWMAAADALYPVAAEGYDLAHLNSLGPISRSASNATSTAWRDGALQIVHAEGQARAAIVAPLLAPRRCIGVLAVEIEAPRETNTTVQSVTALIAAQLATVLTAWPAASTDSTAEVLPFDRAAAAVERRI